MVLGQSRSSTHLRFQWGPQWRRQWRPTPQRCGVAARSTAAGSGDGVGASPCLNGESPWIFINSQMIPCWLMLITYPATSSLSTPLLLLKSPQKRHPFHHFLGEVPPDHHLFLENPVKSCDFTQFSEFSGYPPKTSKNCLTFCPERPWWVWWRPARCPTSTWVTWS